MTIQQAALRVRKLRRFGTTHAQVQLWIRAREFSLIEVFREVARQDAGPTEEDAA